MKRTATCGISEREPTDAAAPPSTVSTADATRGGNSVRQHRPERQIELLFFREDVAQGVLPQSPESPVDGNTQEPQLRHAGDVLPGKLPSLVEVGGHRYDHLLRELSYARSESEVIGVEVPFHRVGSGGSENSP